MNLLESARAVTASRVAGLYHLNSQACGKIKKPWAQFKSETEDVGELGMWVRRKRMTDSFKLHPGLQVFRSLSIDGKNCLFWPKLRRKVHSSTVGLCKMSRWSGSDDQIFSYKLTESCGLVLQQGNITQWFINGETDAIVNAANERMLGGGGVDGAIHRAAGPELLRACRNVPEVRPGVRCPTGCARITEAFSLPVSRIIHTVGPVYERGADSASALSSAYRSCLKLARENQIKFVAFPAISCGVYGYPVDEAAEVSLTTIQKHADDLEEVHFVLFDQVAWRAWLGKADELLEPKRITND
eukprot:Gb_12730 [translate_table: standard]